jgi:parallel beta-helix repeat protein
MKLVLCALVKTIALASGLSLTAAKTVIAQPTIPPSANTPGLSPSLSASPPYSCSTNYYVDWVNGNDSNPGTQAKPWKTIQNADNGYPNVPTPGECGNVLPGVYNLTKGLIFAHGGNSNSLRGYVVYRSMVPQAAHLVAAVDMPVGNLISVWAPYIIIDGFEIDGNHVRTNGHGIDGCTGGGRMINIAHHFVAINNVIHDMGGAGLNSCTADYITWRNNIVYNTSSTNPYQVSGINVWNPKALTLGSFTPTASDKVQFGIIISYNIAHDNSEGPSILGEHTDGNGIIIDTTLGSASCATCGTPYAGGILVLSNVSYNNGGGGIHVFLSSDVTVANNTVYNNYRDQLNPAKMRGELSNGGSKNITWVNNIAIAVPGSGILSNNRPIVTFPLSSGFEDSGTWTRNIAVGGKVISDETSYVNPSMNLISVDPQLTNPVKGNFVPLSSSPALGAGLPESYIPSPVPNIGAY